MAYLGTPYRTCVPVAPFALLVLLCPILNYFKIGHKDKWRIRASRTPKQQRNTYKTSENVARPKLASPHRLASTMEKTKRQKDKWYHFHTFLPSNDHPPKFTRVTFFLPSLSQEMRHLNFFWESQRWFFWVGEGQKVDVVKACVLSAVSLLDRCTCATMANCGKSPRYKPLRDHVILSYPRWCAARNILRAPRVYRCHVSSCCITDFFIGPFQRGRFPPWQRCSKTAHEPQYYYQAVSPP